MGVEKRCPRLGWGIEGIGGLKGSGDWRGRRAGDWRGGLEWGAGGGRRIGGGGGGGLKGRDQTFLILLPSKSTKRIENMELHQAKNIKFLVASCEDTQVSYPKDSPKRNMEED